MRKNIYSLLFVVCAVVLIGCNQKKPAGEEQCEKAEKVKTVMSKEAQEQLTPEAALQDLMDGNGRYINGKLTNRDFPAQIAATTKGQYPKAVILTCIDSRVPVEYIFDQGIGDVFVARVAGNIEDEEMLGSLEYGVGVAGSKLIMVLGHENCGAVKSAIKKVDVGSKNVATLLEHIQVAVDEVAGERDVKNKEYFNEVVKNNVLQTVDDIRKRSDIIANLEKEGKIKVVGAYYSLTDGKVTILE